MSAYCFFDVREITDHAKVEEYLAGVFETVEQYGGRYLVLGGKSDIVEGDWQPVYPVIVEFSDREQAHRWYSFVRIRTAESTSHERNPIERSVFRGRDAGIERWGHRS